MLTNSIVVGSLWFWIICGLEFCLLWWFSCEKNSGGKAFITVLLFIIILVLFGNFHPIDWLIAHPKKFISVVLMYFVLGIFVAMIKLQITVGKDKKKFFNRKISWINTNCTKSETDDVKELRWQEFLLKKIDSGYPNYSLPSYEDYKNDVKHWMVWWVFVIIDIILSDLIKKIWNVIYDLFEGVYRSIFNYTFKDVKLEYDNARAHIIKKEQQTSED